MITSNFIVSSQDSLTIQKKIMGRGGGGIVVVTLVKSNIYELEEEVRAGISRKMRKLLIGLVQGVLGKKRLLVRFQDGCKNNVSSNQPTIVIV